MLDDHWWEPMAAVAKCFHRLAVGGQLVSHLSALLSGESFELAARREVWEETGIEVEERHLSWLWTIRYRAKLD